MVKKNLNIIPLVSDNSCFDLQFRKDTRYKRTNSPTYYRWKVQFVVTLPKTNLNLLKKIKNVIGCGKIHIIKNQARLSVQKIEEVAKYIIPFFKKNKLTEKKKKDFELWQKAVDIIWRNKGKYILKWKKNDFLSLIEIQKSSAKYKEKPKKSKWIQMAQSFTKTL